MEKHAAPLPAEPREPHHQSPASLGEDVFPGVTDEPYLALPACKNCELCTGMGNFDNGDDTPQQNDKGPVSIIGLCPSIL